MFRLNTEKEGCHIKNPRTRSVRVYMYSQYESKNGINTFTSLSYSRSGTHVLISFIGSSTLGEQFNPAKDCSDIVENLSQAKDGFYWIKPTVGKLLDVKIIQVQNERRDNAMLFLLYNF